MNCSDFTHVRDDEIYARDFRVASFAQANIYVCHLAGLWMDMMLNIDRIDRFPLRYIGRACAIPSIVIITPHKRLAALLGS